MADNSVWTPPDNPDAHAILNEAARDARDGRHAVALEKHVWFHDNALRLHPALSGVRLSFALAYWRKLAESYPPAMEALRHTRDKAESQFLQSGFGFAAFGDLAALNRTFGEQERTVAAFKVADRTNQNAASGVYHVAEPYLVRQQEYALCGKYLEPKKQLEMAIDNYESMLKFESDRTDTASRPPDIARKAFVQRATTLVALLVRNDRTEEANWVAEAARLHLSDEAFKHDLDSALTGKVPAPWP